ncbi:MAG: hypothetical protein M3548_15825 [Actinomycetota bacterium]|nr:hypothetical protein [Actinomycetota bacterium]
MAFTMEYTGTHRDVTYALTVATDSDSTDVGLDLLGTDSEGQVVAEGSLRLPAGGATETAALLNQALTAIATLEGKRPRKRVGNSFAPWTPPQDKALYDDWLRQRPDTPATTAIRELATTRQRSPAAIRARLARIGCDPDVAGRLLSPEAAELVGRDATSPSTMD